MSHFGIRWRQIAAATKRSESFRAGGGRMFSISARLEANLELNDLLAAYGL